MAAIKPHIVVIVGALAGCTFAGFLVVSQQYHPNTVNGGLLRYGWFSPTVEKAITTDLLVPPVTAGAGTATYARGELDASLSNGLDSVVKAFDRASHQLQFTTVSETRAASSTVIIARTAQEKQIEFKVTAAADNVTEVAILIGDEALARAIFDKIKASL
jgi:hypothetical protein